MDTCAKQCGAPAGHVFEYNVMDLMVGNRRAPGATTLGGVLEYLTCQPSLFVSRRRVLYFVMGSPVDSVRDGVLPGVSCCGSQYPLPRRCGDVTFSRFVTPLRARDSNVWFEGALPLTVQLGWGARSCVIKG